MPMRKLEHHTNRVCRSNAARAHSSISLPLPLARSKQEPMTLAIFRGSRFYP